MTRRHWLGFFGFCVMAASGWLVEGAWPSVMPAASRQCLHYLIIACTVGFFGWREIFRGGFGAIGWAKLAVASVCLFGIPAALIETARSGVAEATIAALFALLPVTVVLLIAHVEVGERVDVATTDLLAPALVGLAGTLLLLPFALPATFREARLYAVIVLAVLIAASAGVWMYRLLAGVRVVEVVVIGCLANAMFALAVSLASSTIDGSSWAAEWSWNAAGVEALKALCVDTPQIVLLLWLMREVFPAQLAARAFVVPLLTVLEGYALLRPVISARSIGGAVLLIFGAWRLLTGSLRDDEPRLMPG